jgi:hypothetical protein
MMASRRYSTPLFFFLPSNAMRQGDFSALSTPLIDPFAGKRCPGSKIPSRRSQSSKPDGFDLRVDRTITSKQSMFVRWSWKKPTAQSLTDTALGTRRCGAEPDSNCLR